jgi:hypothetical protein
MFLFSSPDEYLFNLETTSPAEAKRKWKRSIKEEWGFKCCYCESTENLSLDHVLPKVHGGTDEVNNIVCACVSCNKDKGHQKMEEWYKQQSFFTLERFSKIIEWRETR